MLKDLKLQSTINKLFSVKPSPTVGYSGESFHSPSTKNLISYLHNIKSSVRRRRRRRWRNCIIQTNSTFRVSAVMSLKTWWKSQYILVINALLDSTHQMCPSLERSDTNTNWQLSKLHFRCQKIYSEKFQDLNWKGFSYGTHQVESIDIIPTTS